MKTNKTFVKIFTLWLEFLFNFFLNERFSDADAEMLINKKEGVFTYIFTYKLL